MDQGVSTYTYRFHFGKKIKKWDIEEVSWLDFPNREEVDAEKEVFFFFFLHRALAIAFGRIIHVTLKQNGDKQSCDKT